MEEEYAALMSNCTWEQVPQPRGSNMMINKWIFTHKFLSDGTIDYYKAHWILQDFTRCPRVNYSETFSLVVKPAIIRMVLALAVARDWPIQ
jgi:hypothetical protein